MNRPKRADSKPIRAATLPDAELEVMAFLWQQGQATVSQIRSGIADYRPLAHGSVVTLLKRLAAKDLVKREKGPRGKAYLYLPTSRPEPAYRHLLKNLCDRIFGGSAVTLVASLFDGDRLSDEELKQLQKMLVDLRSKRTHKQGGSS